MGFAPAEKSEFRVASAGAATERIQSPLLRQTLDEFLDELDSEAPSLASAPMAASITLSAGYVLWNLRNVYLLASALLAAPLWRQFDPLAVLDIWDKTGKPVAGLDDEEEDEDEVLRPVLG